MSTGLHRAAVADSLASLQAAAGATANGTALDVKGWDGVLFQFTGSSPVGTITFEGSADDGTTWVSIEAYNIADGTVSTTATAVGDFVATCAGLSNVRARLTWTSGTFTVGARAFPGAAAAALVGSSATSGGTSNVNVAKINNVTPLMGAGNTGTGSARVTIATDQVAVPVSSTTLSTAAKQPALGTAGSASVDVITMQGVASMTPVLTNVSAQTAGTPTHTADTTVDATGGGVSLIASNAARKGAFIQNVGSANMRVSVGGTPTTTNGIQLVPGASLILSSPFCPTGAIKAIRETATSSTAAVLEIA